MFLHVRKIAKMLTRQSANSKETMAEEQQSGNGCASKGIDKSLGNVIVTIHNFHTTLHNDTKKKDNTGVHVEEIFDNECVLQGKFICLLKK